MGETWRRSREGEGSDDDGRGRRVLFFLAGWLRGSGSRRSKGEASEAGSRKKLCVAERGWKLGFRESVREFLLFEGLFCGRCTSGCGGGGGGGRREVNFKVERWVKGGRAIPYSLGGVRTL